MEGDSESAGGASISLRFPWHGVRRRATIGADKGEEGEASIGWVGVVSRAHLKMSGTRTGAEGDCSAAPDALTGDAGASRRHWKRSGAATGEAEGEEESGVSTGRGVVGVVSRAHRNKSGTSTGAEGVCSASSAA